MQMFEVQTEVESIFKYVFEDIQHSTYLLDFNRLECICIPVNSLPTLIQNVGKEKITDWSVIENSDKYLIMSVMSSRNNDIPLLYIEDKHFDKELASNQTIDAAMQLYHLRDHKIAPDVVDVMLNAVSSKGLHIPYDMSINTASKNRLSSARHTINNNSFSLFKLGCLIGYYAAVTHRFAKALAIYIHTHSKSRRVLEVLAGTGSLAFHVRQYLKEIGSDVTYIATDDNSWLIPDASITPVIQMDAYTANKTYSNADIVIMSWPPDEFNDKFLRSMGKKQNLIVIGSDDQYDSETGDSEFWWKFNYRKLTSVDKHYFHSPDRNDHVFIGRPK